ncbi:MAG: hypothetical protein COY58_05575 [Gammaproteobacteria bacterium CG_4_10_14_0_8_um_filter_38_16]|nr:MAG: hypothetical protein COY58_05575 [Gammaproteobacteria bacterium CG_4_10_14_0_8_um_filter_38_16]PJA04361.1 MAG: hypothetical protein COX72_00185 [Gammaproteobacteria bacterium CG_4_10_14_0_2_um_filter_38_22]PJB09550.1 MAG: hypothetical protein CO120_09575 [Gammaproteobacteria bacterium CG_4_9_14_3_um_filter_38_9]
MWFTKKWLLKFLLTPIVPSRSYLCDFSRICHEVRPPDILLIQGRNRISQIVQRITQSPWSHAALYIGHIHNIDDPKLREFVQQNYKGPLSEQLLVEALVGQGTIIVPISKYKNEHIRVCRPTGLSHLDSQRIIKYAINSIGPTYNIRHFFDLGRFLLSSKFIPRRWNSSLFKKHAGKARQDICSVMIAKAFASVKFPILPLIRKNDQKQLEMIHRNPKLYTPSDFDYSPYFDIIKYPMIPVAGFGLYHHLPWQADLISNDDQGIVLSDEHNENE